ncbi:MAG: T9SS type A sorting domain-containing protein [Bacteroidetes bacterium]|nr:T9SS type A sorting domain-containing protein [Bacteroidota bacterium]
MSGDSITLTAGNATTYQWFKNGNILTGITTKTITVADSGSYTVRVSNSYGCTKISNPVAVSYAAQPPTWVTASGPLTICAGSSVTLKTSAGTGYTYQWYKYGNPISGATIRTLIVTTSGSYRVQFTNASGCTKKSGSKIVTVLALPAAIITPSGPTTICAGDSVDLNANTGAGYTYSWKKYGNVIPGATAAVYTAKSAGPYKVVVTNSIGCSKASATKTVSVITCRKALVETIESIIYPNPVLDFLYFEKPNISKIEIRNLEGKIVVLNEMGNTESINVSQLSPGLYVAVIYTKTEVVTERFVKAEK